MSRYCNAGLVCFSLGSSDCHWGQAPALAVSNSNSFSRQQLLVLYERNFDHRKRHLEKGACLFLQEGSVSTMQPGLVGGEFEFGRIYTSRKLETQRKKCG